MSRPEDDGGFLGRWAKRKQAVQLEAKQELKKEIAPTNQALVDGKPTEVTSENDTKKEEQLPLPSLDDVLPGGDVSMFLQKHVPDSLRNMALRKAWATDPEISTFIEMAENQWDFNNPDSIAGFSSKLENVDLKAMVERVFNNVAPQKENAPTDEEIAAQSDEKQQPSTTAKSPENIIMDTKYTGNPQFSSLNHAKSADFENHAASQETTIESAVYTPIKKRHGGALPS